MTTQPLTRMLPTHDMNEAAMNDEDRTVRSSLPARFQPSYTTRHVAQAMSHDPARFHLVSGTDVHPEPGDVVIAEVTRIGNHKRIETPESRKAILFEGRLVILAYGNRYAADQFLAHVPDSLEPLHLVAAGGIAGMVTASHDKMASPTQIRPLGLVADETGVVTLERYAPYLNEPVAGPAGDRTARPEVIGILGTSMNSGKSTLMACLINGLVNGGLKVGAGKITGTGAGNDPMIYGDAGASRVLDFTDFGYPTTFRAPMEDLRALTVNLVDALTEADTDVVVVEIADGVYQEETARLLRDDIFQATIDHVMFAATDALGARAGVHELVDAGLRVSAASGVMTSSPLATTEAHTVLSDFAVPVVGTFALQDPLEAVALRARQAVRPGAVGAPTPQQA
ncbi:DUF1611 domain-containing protein [Kocuria palustris]|uniref:DUF1611 domain-containing protein n=1 Tax=Kocuria palustris TaxID=71999 RepID=UPI0021B433F7|nr:DUF1611 domain-containing protein [Kocuria palustris]